ncbi:hypothetical protein AGLY_010020 [Aphis glycines]|uniref:Transmembrane protein n=1 Tax=Aphis glycines TaxID=307491 RepID=A0A6G0TG80_APHGL|nr:hypothetical protein AGLY_010020 [Aphis glycines]
MCNHTFNLLRINGLSLQLHYNHYITAYYIPLGKLKSCSHMPTRQCLQNNEFIFILFYMSMDSTYFKLAIYHLRITIDNVDLFYKTGAHLISIFFYCFTLVKPSNNNTFFNLNLKITSKEKILTLGLELVGVAYCSVCFQFIADQARNSLYTLMRLNTKLNNAFFCIFCQF